MKLDRLKAIFEAYCDLHNVTLNYNDPKTKEDFFKKVRWPFNEMSRSEAEEIIETYLEVKQIIEDIEISQSFTVGVMVEKEIQAIWNGPSLGKPPTPGAEGGDGNGK